MADFQKVLFFPFYRLLAEAVLELDADEQQSWLKGLAEPDRTKPMSSCTKSEVVQTEKCSSTCALN